MDTTSLWQALSGVRKESYPALSEEIEVDVAIVGGGITGLTAAYHLESLGKKVAILEAYQVGEGTTGNSTGNLYIETQPYFQNIEEKFNLEIAMSLAHSRRMAIDEIEKNVKEKNINCNFARRPLYFFCNDKDQINFLHKEIKLLTQLGIEIDSSSELPIPFKFKKAAMLPNQARFNPLKYTQGLARDLHKKNVLIYEKSHVIEISEKKVCTLKTLNGKVTAKKVIIATHTPIGINTIQMFTAPYRSYVIAARLKEHELPEGHFWGIGENQKISSTHCANAGNKPDLLLVAGSHHKTGQTNDALSHFKDLENYLKKQIDSFEIVHRWSAQHYQTADNVPYIGLAHSSAKHTYMATGFFADGLIYGTIAGRVLSDLIVKADGQLANVYNPHRHAAAISAGFVMKENLNVFMQYLKDLPSSSSRKYADIKTGEGKVLTINGEKCGVCRDDENRLHAVSAVCTHMKCIVNWNSAEKTWDCPCHGSRFSLEGKVLEGPAMSDLKKKQSEI